MTGFHERKKERRRIAALSLVEAEARIRKQVRRDRLNEEHEVLVQGGHVADPVDAFLEETESEKSDDGDSSDNILSAKEPETVQYDDGVDTVTAVITAIPDSTDRNMEWMNEAERNAMKIRDGMDRDGMGQNEMGQNEMDQNDIDSLNHHNADWLHPNRGNWGKKKEDGEFEEYGDPSTLTIYEKRKRRKRLLQKTRELHRQKRNLKRMAEHMKEFGRNKKRRANSKYRKKPAKKRKSNRKTKK